MEQKKEKTKEEPKEENWLKYGEGHVVMNENSSDDVKKQVEILAKALGINLEYHARKK